MGGEDKKVEKMRVVISSLRRVLPFFSLLVFIPIFSNNSYPKVSIITSMVKGEYYIAQFLADITRQTIFDQCELIILNANKLGYGWEEGIINKYRQKYPRNIIYRRLPNDPGLYGVWNMGIKLARGKYISNANVDDRLAPDCYEVHSKILDENPDVDLAYSDSYITRIPNETFEMNSALGSTKYPEFEPEKIKGANMPSFNPMWRKEFHQKYGYFDTTFKIVADWEMWVRAIVGGAKFKKAQGRHGLFYYNTQGISLNRATFDVQEKERDRVRTKYSDFFKS